MDDNDFYRGIIFILIGIVIVCYVFYKRKRKKDYNDLKGYIGGFGSIILGLYLIVESFTNQF